MDRLSCVDRSEEIKSAVAAESPLYGAGTEDNPGRKGAIGPGARVPDGLTGR
jgi:hypothetical protein